MGAPGWCTQLSSSPLACPFLYVALQPFRRHVLPSGISSDGSSSSDSGGGGGAVGAGCGVSGARVGVVDDDDTASASLEARELASLESGAAFFSISGGRSVVLCLPSVHGAISRNSSKVRTLGLQHFQPRIVSDSPIYFHITDWITITTFLPLVEDWRTRMVHAHLVRIGIQLAATLVDTLLSHRWGPRLTCFFFFSALKIDSFNLNFEDSRSKQI